MITFKILIGSLFGLLVAAIAFLGFVSYEKNLTSNKTFTEVARTYELLDKAEKVSSIFKDIQLESTAFYISSDSSSVVPYLHARHGIFAAIAGVKELTGQNAEQQERIDSLNILITRLIALTDSGFTPDAGTYSDEGLQERIRVNRLLREQIRSLINAIEGVEKDLLIKRQNANEASVRSFQSTFMQLLVGIAVLLAATFLTIRHSFNNRMEAERELKKANELFFKIFHESPIGIVISRLEDGAIIDCNNAYAEMVNYDRKELIGKSAAGLGIIAGKGGQDQMIQPLTVAGVVQEVETSLQPRGRDALWASISMQAVRVSGKPCILSAIIDMTTHKRAEEEIRKALETEMELNRLKSNFVTLASHEFRTPLTTILSSAFLLENYAFGEDRQKAARHLARIKSAVNNLTSILDEFLSLSRIEEGQIEPNAERLNIKDYLENGCQNLRTLTKVGQRIIYYHEGQEIVKTDPALIGNILNNLVSNAIKYSPEHTDIIVSSVVNNAMRLSVRDSGIGIPVEDQKNLFNRFYRASNAGNVQGTGLGLHIMKHYVDMLDGTLEVNSVVGKGTEFRLTFSNIQG